MLFILSCKELLLINKEPYLIFKWNKRKKDLTSHNFITRGKMKMNQIMFWQLEVILKIVYKSHENYNLVFENDLMLWNSGIIQK